MDKLTFGIAVDLFIKDRKSENLSPETLQFYRDKLRKLQQLLDKQGKSTYPQEISSKEIKENGILYMMEEEELQISTIHTYLRGWKAFFNFLVRDEYLSVSPFKKVKMPKFRRKIIQTFDEDQLVALLEQPKKNTFAGVRDYTLIMLFLETGVRVREMSEIKVSDINWERNSITVRGKGDKERFVYFQEKMRQLLLQYLQFRSNSHTPELFITTHDEAPLCRREIQHRLNHYGKMAGITGVRVSPHTLRHTFARMSVKNKAGLFALQSMLGHSTLNQVLTYVNLFSDEIKNEHKKFSPLQNFGQDNNHDINILPFKQRDRKDNNTYLA
ncbi:tyrosine-type recombinase/integrase [Cohnella sp.]|uniref:tyrosine-type recombinase/integrase n=1 Tax=Cohnella sp. TaxID=1883426 RepID=UPI0035698237